MKPFQQLAICNLGYIIPKSNITPTQTIIFIGLQDNKPNPNVDPMTINSEMEHAQIVS